MVLRSVLGLELWRFGWWRGVDGGEGGIGSRGL